LLQQHEAVIDVHPSLYPRTGQERKIWESAIEKGWAVGVEQADYLFEQGVNCLNRDLRGIIRYRVLALQGIVNVPLIATAETGTRITEKKRKLQLAKTVVRLVNDVQFVEEDKWFPIAK
jgi:defect-in-organelle-trafficking protein DotC